MKICNCDMLSRWNGGPKPLPDEYSPFLQVSSYLWQMFLNSMSVISFFFFFAIYAALILSLPLLSWTGIYTMRWQHHKNQSSLSPWVIARRTTTLDGLTLIRIFIGEIKLCCIKPQRFLSLLLTAALVDLSWLIQHQNHLIYPKW